MYSFVTSQTADEMAIDLNKTSDLNLPLIKAEGMKLGGRLQELKSHNYVQREKEIH